MYIFIRALNLITWFHMTTLPRVDRLAQCVRMFYVAIFTIAVYDQCDSLSSGAPKIFQVRQMDCVSRTGTGLRIFFRAGL